LNIIKREVLLPGAREVKILRPETICHDIVVADGDEGYLLLMSNGTGYSKLIDIFALATSLESNEIIHYPLEFAHSDAYKYAFPTLKNHYRDIALFNFNTTQINAKDLSTALKTKVYREIRLTRQIVLSEKHPDRWKTEHKLTVKSMGQLLIISGERDVFTAMAQSCADLSEFGDYIKYNNDPPHQHHDLDENTAKSVGIIFYYWHSGNKINSEPKETAL